MFEKENRITQKELAFYINMNETVLSKILNNKISGFVWYEKLYLERKKWVKQILDYKEKHGKLIINKPIYCDTCNKLIKHKRGVINNDGKYYCNVFCYTKS